MNVLDLHGEFRLEAVGATYSRLNAYWLAQCSALAYESPGVVQEVATGWGFDQVLFCDRSLGWANGCEFWVGAHRDGYSVTAFRGSTDVLDFRVNSRYGKRDTPFGRVHYGFSEHTGYATAEWQRMCAQVGLAPSHATFLTGHSKGAAHAILEAMLRAERGVGTSAVYAIASPRVGGWHFAGAYDFAVPHTYRLTHNNDIVSRVPPAHWNYRHVGKHHHFDHHGRRVVKPSKWVLLWDRLVGRLRGNLLLDGLHDHSMEGFVRLTKADLEGVQ